MEERTLRFWFARLAAPLVFFAAATLLVMIVRESFDDDAAGRVATFEQTDASGDTVIVTTTLTETEPVPDETGEVAAEEVVVTEKECTPPRRRTYRIKAGDTFESIAAKVCTTSTELRNLNPLVDSVALQTGRTIVIRPRNTNAETPG